VVILSLKRSLRSISLHPQKANYLQQHNAYALTHIPSSELLATAQRLRTPTPPKSDSYGAQRLRTPTSQKAIPTERNAYALPHPQQRFLRSASLSHIPTSTKQRFLRSASLSHSPHSQKRSHPHIPNKRSHSQHPKSDRTPNIPKAIAPPTPKAIAPHIPKSDRSQPPNFK
jgi:hypothetical protein